MIRRYDLAPLDGITKVVFRKVWAAHFGGADRYFIPFFSPTPHHILTDRDRREIDPAHNGGLPLKKFFNTSGLQYKALGLKDKLPAMTEEEQFALLATDGMLVKRPILVGDGFVLTGFRQAEWEEKLK